VETTSLLKNEEMTPRLGWSTDVLLTHGQSFFSSKKMVQDEQFLSISENGPDRTVIFVMKMVQWIVDVP
jgi:hypothetical protein